VTKGLRSGAVLRAAIHGARSKDAILGLLCRFAEFVAAEPDEPPTAPLGEAGGLA
jgi:hypothetical protein